MVKAQCIWRCKCGEQCYFYVAHKGICACRKHAGEFRNLGGYRKYRGKTKIVFKVKR